MFITFHEGSVVSQRAKLCALGYKFALMVVCKVVEETACTVLHGNEICMVNMKCRYSHCIFWWSGSQLCSLGHKFAWRNYRPCLMICIWWSLFFSWYHNCCLKVFLPSQKPCVLVRTLVQRGSCVVYISGTLPPGLLPAHKASIVMFLERVYGIEDQSTFFRLLEDCFLSDLRAATTLDMVQFMPYSCPTLNSVLTIRLSLFIS